MKREFVYRRGYDVSRLAETQTQEVQKERLNIKMFESERKGKLEQYRKSPKKSTATSAAVFFRGQGFRTRHNSIIMNNNSQHHSYNTNYNERLFIYTVADWKVIQCRFLFCYTACAPDQPWLFDSHITQFRDGFIMSVIPQNHNLQRYDIAVVGNEGISISTAGHL